MTIWTIDYKGKFEKAEKGLKIKNRARGKMPLAFLFVFAIIKSKEVKRMQEEKRMKFPKKTIAMQFPVEIVNEINDLANLWKLNRTATVRKLIENAYENYILRG